MAGTREGGRLAAAKNLANDPNFYSRIGGIGGRNGRTGGFAANPELARRAGIKGGRRSIRGYTLTSVKDDGTTQTLSYLRDSDGVTKLVKKIIKVPSEY